MMGFGGWGTMDGYGFWGWLVGLGVIVWVMVGILLVVFLWKQISQK